MHEHTISVEVGHVGPKVVIVIGGGPTQPNGSTLTATPEGAESIAHQLLRAATNARSTLLPPEPQPPHSPQSESSLGSQKA